MNIAISFKQKAVAVILITINVGKVDRFSA